MKTPDQERAAHAWKCVQEARKLDDKARKEFGIQAKKLPTRILTSGLGPALAFLEAKDYAPLLRDALAEWMNVKQPIRKPEEKAEDLKPRLRLVVRIVEEDADFLRFATAECLAYLLWLVRFAEAEGVIGNED